MFDKDNIAFALDPKRNEMAAHFTVEQRTQVGINLYASVVGDGKFAQEVLSNLYDTEIRMAIYHAIYDKFIDLSDMEKATELLMLEGISVTLADIHAKARERVRTSLETRMSLGAMFRQRMDAYLKEGVVENDGGYSRRQREEAQRKRMQEGVRKQFNTQHAPAPEGTVKELAARYGVSLSEIRRHKAAGTLNTLTEKQS